MTRRMTGWALVILLLAGVVWKMAAQNAPQVKVTKGWILPYTDPEDPRKKILFTGDEANPLTGNRGMIQVRRFRMTKFVDGDETRAELIIEAAECFFEPQTKMVSSTGPIKA